jgi:hypothetical protein
MTQWEYKSFNQTFTSMDVSRLRLEWFNALGGEGWEIVNESSAFNADYTTCSVFILAKRPKS